MVWVAVDMIRVVSSPFYSLYAWQKLRGNLDSSVGGATEANAVSQVGLSLAETRVLPPPGAAEVVSMAVIV